MYSSSQRLPLFLQETEFQEAAPGADARSNKGTTT
jgi:hypothetical protein